MYPFDLHVLKAKKYPFLCVCVHYLILQTFHPDKINSITVKTCFLTQLYRVKAIISRMNLAPFYLPYNHLYSHSPPGIPYPSSVTLPWLVYADSNILHNQDTGDLCHSHTRWGQFPCRMIDPWCHRMSGKKNTRHTLILQKTPLGGYMMDW